MNFHIVLSKFYADKKWTMRGDEYSGLEWLDLTDKPTEDVLRDLWPQCQYDDKIIAIKEEAQRRIIELTGGGIYWREKQLNMLALFSEITRDAVEAGGFQNLSSEKLAQKAALEEFWTTVKALRAYSNDLEISVLACNEPKIYDGWPA